MKKSKKFLIVASLLVAAALSFVFVKESGLIAKAASIVNNMSTPHLNYAYYDESGEVTVSYNAVRNAKKYRVYRKVAGGKWTCIKETVATKIIDKTAKRGRTYYYTVRAVRYTRNNKKVLSSFVKNGIKAVKLNPAAPKLKSAKASSKGITVTWNKTKNTTKYALYRRVSGGKWQRITTTSKNSFVDKTAKFKKVYYYTVRAIKVFDRVEYYSNFNKTGIIGVTYYPGQPKVTLAIYKSKAAHITWNQSYAANYYRVLRKDVGGEFEEIAKTKSTCYIDTTANDYSAYYYTVQAVNNETGYNYYSAYNKKGLLMSREASDFKLDKITAKLGKVYLNWSPYENAEGYVIYRKRTDASDDTYELIKNIKFSKITSYVDLQTAKHTKYTYVVKPYFANEDNSNLFAIGTVNTCDGKGKVNVNPNPTKKPAKKTKVDNKKEDKHNSAQDIMDQIYDEETVHKTMSVIGDSISTFSGISSGSSYYPKNNVVAANDMWWKKAANTTGMDICKINALNGRRLTTTKAGNTSAVETCLNVTKNGTEPDVIVSFIGINDFINGVKLGSYNSSKRNLTSAVSKNTTEFVDAYCVMINKLRRNYPDSKIVICTLPSGCVDSKNKKGDSLASWNSQIRKIANGFGLKVISFDRSSLNSSNRANATIDGIHPNKKGQSYLANTAASTLKSVF